MPPRGSVSCIPSSFLRDRVPLSHATVTISSQQFLSNSSAPTCCFDEPRPKSMILHLGLSFNKDLRFATKLRA